jgi:hypothetical protein
MPIQGLDISLNVRNNTNYPQQINVMGNPSNLLDTANATTEYRYDLTGFTITNEDNVSIQYRKVGDPSFSTFTWGLQGTDLQGIIIALNNLGIGYFNLYNELGNTYVGTYNDDYEYGDLAVYSNASPTTTTTTTTTTIAPTTTTTTTTTTLVPPPPTTTTTTTTTTAAPTTTTTTTSTTTAAPTTTTTTTSTTTAAPTTTTTTTSTTTAAPTTTTTTTSTTTAAPTTTTTTTSTTTIAPTTTTTTTTTTLGGINVNVYAKENSSTTGRYIWYSTDAFVTYTALTTNVIQIGQLVGTINNVISGTTLYFALGDTIDPNDGVTAIALKVSIPNDYPAIPSSCNFVGWVSADIFASQNINLIGNSLNFDLACSINAITTTTTTTTTTIAPTTTTTTTTTTTIAPSNNWSWTNNNVVETPPYGGGYITIDVNGINVVSQYDTSSTSSTTYSGYIPINIGDLVSIYVYSYPNNTYGTESDLNVQNPIGNIIFNQNDPQSGAGSPSSETFTFNATSTDMSIIASSNSY